MKFGFLLLFGIIMLVLCLIESFFLNDGHIFDKDEDGSFKLKIKGGVDATGWGRALILAAVVGFFASIAAVKPLLGMFSLIVMIVVMIYITYWSINEASSPKEVIVFIIMLIVAQIVAKMGAIAMGGMMRSYAWLSVLMTIPGVALAICIALIIAAVLKYHADSNPHGLDKDKRKLLSLLAVVTVVVGLGIGVYLLVTGVKWKGF